MAAAYRSQSSAFLLAAMLLSSWLCTARPAEAASQEAPEDLSDLSLSALANLKVTSVSKSSETLQQAAAAVYVITHDAIRDSAATSIFEALRLAPNLLVTQLSATTYQLSARGFGGNPAAQSFSNKLLMLVDGRSVYTPLYSGVYADTVDLPLGDIERIEVISGPGATLWGANAMNGVINIITRSAYGSQGMTADAEAGNQTRFGSGDAGVSIGNAALRTYGLAFDRRSDRSGSGADADDGWYKAQGGFRYDWTHQLDDVTVQGDVYRALEDQFASGEVRLVGANLLTRWERHEEISDFRAQFYYDQSERMSPEGGGAFVLHTYDLELQDTLALGRNRLVLGTDERINSYGITSTSTLIFSPEDRNLTLGDVFVEDTLSLSSRFAAVAGVKVEDDAYSGWSVLPDARFSWLVSPRTTLWGAVSQAIRSPTPFDTDVIEKIGPSLALLGKYDFSNEKLTAYQLGARGQPSAALSVSITAFDHEYRDLRTIEPATVTQFFPLRFDNLLAASAQGLEAWATWQVESWWVLTPGVVWEHEHFSFLPGASALLGPSALTNDPSVHADVGSTIRLSAEWSLFGALRYVGARPDPTLSAYVDADARLARALGSHWQLSLAGTNLLHGQRAELLPPNGEKIVRSAYLELRWRQ